MKLRQNILNKNNKNKGLTLIEVLLVVAIIAILAAIIILALNPSKQLADSRNSKRYSDTRTLLDALYQYSIDNNGSFPTGIDTSLRMIGSDTSGCDTICNTGEGSTTSDFSDNEQGDFDQGDYSDTQWNTAESWLELDSNGKTNKMGNFTSRVFDAETNTSWENISWNPNAPYLKELPNNEASEEDYSENNINMSSNELLLHLNESSGSIIDSSGNGNNGTSFGADYALEGKFDKSMYFNGSSDYIEIPNSSNLNISNQITLEVWAKWNIEPTSGNDWAQILNKNGESQYQIQHNFDNTGFEFAINTTSGRTWVIGNTNPVQNKWHHIVATYDGSMMQLYVDGSLDNTQTHSGDIVSSSSSLLLGKHKDYNRHFNGNIDELAIYSRVLSASEISSRYTRGSQRLKFKVRSCDDQLCDSEQFIGPDGTTTTYYSEILNSENDKPILELTNVDDNQYFQYKAILETDDSTATPKLKSVAIDSGLGGAAPEQITQEACLDLEPFLVDAYLSNIPHDPLTDSNAKTFYAVKITNNNRLQVVSCQAELDKIISVKR